MAHAPSGRTVLRVHIALRDGTRIIRSTGTRDARLARQMETMLDDLGHRGAQAWDVLARLDARTLDLPTLYAEWVAAKRSVPKLRDRLRDTLLSGQVEPFLTAIRTKVQPDTVAHYRVHLASLTASIPKASDFTVGAVEAWMGTLPFQPATVRKYAMAASAFAAWLVRQGTLPYNPVRDVPKPQQRRRDRWITEREAQRLADAQPEPYRTLSILLHASGLDVSAALQLRREQLDLDAGTLWNIRPKTKRRHHAVLATWAIPALRKHCAGLLPSARLFVGVDRWKAADAHSAACQAIGLRDYWLRDARHSYAVRLAQAGMPMAQIAECLGHANAQLAATTYTVHSPATADLQAWERTAHQRAG